MNKYCITFYTHYGAIKFNKLCKEKGIESKLMPVPRKVSSSCTTCVFFDADDYQFVKDGNIEDLEEFFLVDNQGYKKLLPPTK